MADTPTCVPLMPWQIGKYLLDVSSPIAKQNKTSLEQTCLLCKRKGRTLCPFLKICVLVYIARLWASNASAQSRTAHWTSINALANIGSGAVKRRVSTFIQAHQGNRTTEFPVTPGAASVVTPVKMHAAQHQYEDQLQ